MKIVEGIRNQRIRVEGVNVAVQITTYTETTFSHNVNGSQCNHSSLLMLRRCLGIHLERLQRREAYWKYVFDENHTLKEAGRHFGKCGTTIGLVIHRHARDVFPHLFSKSVRVPLLEELRTMVAAHDVPKSSKDG